MSYQYQQYPPYFQPPAGVQPPGGGTNLPPPTPDPVPAGSTYLPVDSTATWAEVHSQQLTSLAAGGSFPQFGLLITPAASGSAQYPFLMYNQKDGTTKAAKDAKDKADLASKGYGDNPPPPDPYALTSQMLQDLQLVWTKAGDTLTQLMQLVNQQQKQMQAAGNILGAGQQQGQPQYGQQPQQDPWASQQQPPAPGYPAGD